MRSYFPLAASIALMLSAILFFIGTVTAYPDAQLIWKQDALPIITMEYAAASNDTFYFRSDSNIVAVSAHLGEIKENVTYPISGSLSIIAAGPDGWLYFAIARTVFGFQHGSQKWNHTTVRGTSQAVLTLSPDFSKLAAVDNDAHTVVFEAKTGKVNFKYDANNVNNQSPVGAIFAGRAVVVGNPGGNIVAFDSATGQGLWQYQIDTNVPCSMSATEDGAYIVVLSNTQQTGFFQMTVLDASKGTYVGDVIQKRDTSDAPTWSVSVSPMPYNRAIVMSGTNAYAFDVPSLRLRWIRAITSPQPPVFASGMVIVVRGNNVWALDIEAGDVAWSFSHANSAQSPETSFTGARLAVAMTPFGPYVAASALAALYNLSVSTYRAVYRVPNFAVMSESQCANGPKGPCAGSCVTATRPAVCREDNVSEPVSATKTWHRYYCFHDVDNVMSVQFRRYAGTSCSNNADGNIVYETVQYLGECVVAHNFTSSRLLSCAEEPY